MFFLFCWLMQAVFFLLLLFWGCFFFLPFYSFSCSSAASLHFDGGGVQQLWRAKLKLKRSWRTIQIVASIFLVGLCLATILRDSFPFALFLHFFSFKFCQCTDKGHLRRDCIYLIFMFGNCSWSNGSVFVLNWPHLIGNLTWMNRYICEWRY